MREFVLLRKMTIVIVACVSVAGAIAAIWLLDLTSLSVSQMLAMLALFVLPVVTYVAWQWDRRSLRDRVPPDGDGLFETPEGIDFAEELEAPPPIRESTPGRTAPEAAPAHRRRRPPLRHKAEQES